MEASSPNMPHTSSRSATFWINFAHENRSFQEEAPWLHILRRGKSYTIRKLDPPEFLEMAFLFLSSFLWDFHFITQWGVGFSDCFSFSLLFWTPNSRRRSSGTVLICRKISEEICITWHIISILTYYIIFLLLHHLMRDISYLAVFFCFWIQFSRSSKGGDGFWEVVGMRHVFFRLDYIRCFWCRSPQSIGRVSSRMSMW